MFWRPLKQRRDLRCKPSRPVPASTFTFFHRPCPPQPFLAGTFFLVQPNAVRAFSTRSKPRNSIKSPADPSPAVSNLVPCTTNREGRTPFLTVSLLYRTPIECVI